MDWTKQQGAECVTRCEWKRRMCYTVRVKAQNVLHGASESTECVTRCEWKHGKCYTVRVKARNVLHDASENTECVTRCEWKREMCYMVQVNARDVLARMKKWMKCHQKQRRAILITWLWAEEVGGRAEGIPSIVFIFLLFYRASNVFVFQYP